MVMWQNSGGAWRFSQQMDYKCVHSTHIVTLQHGIYTNGKKKLCILKLLITFLFVDQLL